MPQHKAVYYPEKQDTILDQIDYDIMRDDEMAQVNMDIKHLDFRDTLLYHMRQMNIKQSELVILCEEVISDRTVQRMLSPCKWGARKVILNDLSPAATFIAANYNKPVNPYDFSKVIEKVMDEVEEETKWMYETIIPGTDGKKARINYVLWSDVFICPTCGSELTFWDIALDDNRNMRKEMHQRYNKQNSHVITPSYGFL